MSSLMWFLLGLFLGFVIGALAPNRDNNFISGIQKYLKKGQMVVFSISRHEMDIDGDDGDDDDDSGKPLFPNTEHRFN